MDASAPAPPRQSLLRLWITRQPSPVVSERTRISSVPMPSTMAVGGSWSPASSTMSVEAGWQDGGPRAPWLRSPGYPKLLDAFLCACCYLTTLAYTVVLGYLVNQLPEVGMLSIPAFVGVRLRPRDAARGSGLTAEQTAWCLLMDSYQLLVLVSPPFGGPAMRPSQVVIQNTIAFAFLFCGAMQLVADFELIKELLQASSRDGECYRCFLAELAVVWLPAGVGCVEPARDWPRDAARRRPTRLTRGTAGRRA